MTIRYAFGTFGILTSLALMAQPFNDNPCQAVPLPAGPNCQFQQFNNNNATNLTNGIPNPGCGGYQDNQARDVWFVTQVPPNGRLVIDQSPGTLNNTSMAAYTAASCAGPFTLIACDADGSDNGNMPRLELNGLTPGAPIYIRVWDFYAAGFLGIGGDPSQQGSFNLCVFDPEVVVIGGGGGTITYDCGSTPPAGNTCASSTPICTFDGYCGSTQGYTADFWFDGTQGLGGPGSLFGGQQGIFCGSIENNSFVSFIAGSSTVELEVIVTGSSSCVDGVQFLMFGDPNGPTCGSLAVQSYGCLSPMPPGTNEFTGTGLVPGQEYFLMVDGFAGDQCEYQINAVSGVVVDVSAGPDQNICLGQSATLNVYGNGNGPVSWNGPFLNTTTGTTVVTTPTAPGSYQYIVTATDALIPECNGALSDTVVVNVANAAPVAISVGNCVNGAITLTASGASNYIWSPPVTINQTVGNSVVVTPTNPTTYTVYGASPGGCIIPTSVTVNCDPNCTPPTFTVTPPAPVCAPGTVNLASAVSGTGTNQVSYHATATEANAGTPALPSNSVNTSGTYFVRVQVPGSPNCFAVQPITVTIASPPVLSAGTDVSICDGASTTLSATGATTYAWSPATGLSATNGASVTASPATTTTYTVTGTVDNCTSTAEVTVTVNANPTVTLSTVDPSCGASNGSITASVTGTSGSVTYAWSNGATMAQATDLAAGTFTVTVTTAAGCQGTASATLTSGNGPAITTITTTDPTCGNANGQVAVAASGGTPPLQFSVDGGTTFQAAATFTGLDVGTYSIVVADANNCTSAGNATLATAPALLLTDVATTDPSCGGSDGGLVITASGGTPPYQYSINGGTTSQVSGSFTGLSSNVYSVVVTDANGCTAAQAVSLSSANAPVISNVALTPPTCTNANGSITVTASGGTGALEYSNNGGVTFQATGDFTGLAPGTYAIVVRDADGCQSAASANLPTPSLPIIQNINVTRPECGQSNGGVSIAASGGTAPLQFSIDNGTTFQQFANFVGLPAGSYPIVIRDAEGCTVTGQADIIPLPILAEASAAICQGESFFVGGAAQTTSGTYIDTFTSSLGCDSIVSTSLVVHALPSPGFTVTPLVAPVAEPNFTLLNGATGNITDWVYTWGDGTVTNEPDGQHTYDGPGVYVITQTVTSAQGCTNGFSITVIVRDELRVYIPNAFSPDGDGTNDLFAPVGTGFSSWELWIFNRWGEEIFTTKDTGLAWDGQAGGKPVAIGVYPYLVKLKDANGFDHERRGHVTLLR